MFGEQIRVLAALHGDPEADRVIEAFVTVPREAHVGPGPWTLLTPQHDLAKSRTPNDDPAHLYHCVLVALDEAKGINIGAPTLWARMLAKAVVPAGARVLQVGAGSGYYTAILAELVGPEGSVLGFEVEEKLAVMGKAATKHRANVEIRHGDATADLKPGDGPFDLIVAFAGVTHPAETWMDSLSENGRMLLPVTGSHGWGAMALFETDPATSGREFKVKTLGPCSFYPCQRARTEAMERIVDEYLRDRSRTDHWRFRMLRTDTGVVYRKNGD